MIEQFMRLEKKNIYIVRPANQIKITHKNKLHKTFPHISKLLNTVMKSLVTSEDKYLLFCNVTPEHSLVHLFQALPKRMENFRKKVRILSD